MEYRGPKFDRVEELSENLNGTLIVPARDYAAPEHVEGILTGAVSRGTDSGAVCRDLSNRKDGGNVVAQIRDVDVALLGKLLYEHQRYEAAKGFSDSEMNVLRAIEFHAATRVGVDEIMESDHASDLSESTVYKKLDNLQEKDLVTKVRPGVYRYDGP